MTRADDYILELLDSAGIAANPATIAFNIDYDNSYIANRCQVLTNHGLLDRVSQGKAMYRITDRGRAYLAGEIDAEALEGPD